MPQASSRCNSPSGPACSASRVTRVCTVLARLSVQSSNSIAQIARFAQVRSAPSERIDAGLSGGHAGARPIVAQVGDAAPAGLGKERAGRLALGRGDGGGQRGRTVDRDEREPLLERGFVLHPGGHLLPDIAALAEIDAAQTLETDLEDEGVGGELYPRLGDAMRHPDAVKISAVIALLTAVEPPAEIGVARIGQRALGYRAGAAAHADIRLGDLHVRAQLVERQPLH